MIKTDDLYETYGADFGSADDASEPVRTLTLNFSEEGDQEANQTTIVLEDDKTTYLPTVMAAVEKMLHAMGFDYVSLVNISESGHDTYGYGSVN